MPSAASSAGDGNTPVLLRVLKRYWVPIVLAVVLGGLIGHEASKLQPVRYTAESRLVLSKVVAFDPLGTYVDADASRFIANQVAIMTSEAVLEAAARQLQETTVATLRESVTAAGGSEDDVISVRATAPTARQAKARADAVAEAYESFRLARVTEQTREALSQTESEDRRSTIRTQALTYGSGVSLVQPAVLPESPSRPLPTRDGFVLAVVYGLLAVGYALLRGTRPTHDQVITEAAARADIPVLARIAGGASASSSPAEPYHMLLVTLDYVGRHTTRTLLVTSATEGGGSAVADNLADVASQRGMRVSLLDGYDSGPGQLPDVSERRRAHRATMKGRPRGGETPERRPVRTEVPTADKRGAVPTAGRGPLADVHDGPDLVIIDSPPVARDAEAFAMVSAADAVLFVVDENTTPSDVLEANERLAFAGTRVTGLVLVTRRRPLLRNVLARRPQDRSVSVHQELEVGALDPPKGLRRVTK